MSGFQIVSPRALAMLVADISGSEQGIPAESSLWQELRIPLPRSLYLLRAAGDQEETPTLEESGFTHARPRGGWRASKH